MIYYFSLSGARSKSQEEKEIEIIDLASKSPTKVVRDKHEADLGEIQINLQTNPPLPYKKIAKQKKFLYQPFVWTYDYDQAKKLENSLYKLTRLEANGKSEIFNLQPNTEKINRLRDQIAICFDFFYELCFYNQTEIDYSTEMNKLARLLKTVSGQIDVEKGFDYENHGDTILLNNVVSFELYEENTSIIDEVLKNQLIPALDKTKRKYFAEESLEVRRKELAIRIDKLGNGLNSATIEVAKLQDKGQSALSIYHINSNDLKRIKAVRPPKEFFEEFIDVYSDLRLLYMECKVLSEIRTRFKRYLKIKLFIKELDIQLKFLDKLNINLKKIIDVFNERLLNLKIQPKEIKKTYMKIDLNIDETKLDLDRIIENKTIEKIIVTGIKEVFNHFDKESQSIDLDAVQKENNVKVLITMLKTCQTYLELCINFSKSVERLRGELQQTEDLIKANKYFTITKENIKQELLAEYHEVQDVINRTDYIRNKMVWTPAQLIPALSSSVHEFSLVNKSRVHMNKAIAFKLKYIQNKLAKIIRKRIGVKNKFFFPNIRRIKENLGMNDVIELLKSKRVWQSMPGAKSEIINLQGKSLKNKPLNRYIYCNEDLDKDLLKFIGMFIYGIN